MVIITEFKLQILIFEFKSYKLALKDLQESNDKQEFKLSRFVT